MLITMQSDLQELDKVDRQEAELLSKLQTTKEARLKELEVGYTAEGQV
jgi:hypothetical protein